MASGHGLLIGRREEGCSEIAIQESLLKMSLFSNYVDSCRLLTKTWAVVD